MYALKRKRRQRKKKRARDAANTHRRRKKWWRTRWRTRWRTKGGENGWAMKNREIRERKRRLRGRKREDETKSGEKEEGRVREGERLWSEPETDELMLTAGGSCFRASNDLAGAKTDAGGIDADDGCGKGAPVLYSLMFVSSIANSMIFNRASINSRQTRLYRL